MDKQQPNTTQTPPPTPAAGQPAAPGAQYNLPQVNPGQTLGIIGLILSFVGLAPVGLVLSIISTVKSAKSSTSRALGIVGIVLNALGIILLGFFFLVIVLAVLMNSTGQSQDNSATQANATTVSKRAAAYYAERGVYPRTIADFDTYESSQLDPSISVTSRDPETESEVQYEACGTSGAKVAYLKSSSILPVVLYLGTGSFDTCD